MNWARIATAVCIRRQNPNKLGNLEACILPCLSLSLSPRISSYVAVYLYESILSIFLTLSPSASQTLYGTVRSFCGVASPCNVRNGWSIRTQSGEYTTHRRSSRRAANVIYEAIVQCIDIFCHRTQKKLVSPRGRLTQPSLGLMGAAAAR